MLFYPKNNIFKYVFYDEITSIIFIEYFRQSERAFYKVDRSLFEQVILPQLRKDQDFRQLLFWGLHNGMVAQIDKDHPEVQTIDLKSFRGI